MKKILLLSVLCAMPVLASNTDSYEQRIAAQKQRMAEVRANHEQHRKQVLERIQKRFGQIQAQYQQRQSKPETAIEPEVVCKGEKITLDKVNFSLDSANLSKLATDTLDEVAKTILDNPEMSVEVAGHTDIRGSNLYNDKLSMNRACSVVRYLEKKGVQTKQMIPTPYGETAPKEWGLTEASHAVNRRVELMPK